MDTPNIEALKRLIEGRKPASNRKFSPESIRRKQHAEDLADITDEEVITPLREWLEALEELVSAATEALDDVDNGASELRDAETADEREDAYASLDEAYSTLHTALEELGVE